MISAAVVDIANPPLVSLTIRVSFERPNPPSPIPQMLGLSGLTGRESGGERLVGKDYPAAVGLRVVFSRRYEGDAWARDEGAGRAGTVVELLEPYTHEGRVQHAACRWAHGRFQVF